MATVYRIQPPGLELNHQSETSCGDLADGVHVFTSLEDAARGLAEWVENPGEPEQELVTIACNDDDLDDNGDYEGLLLYSGCGRIVARRSFKTWDEMRAWFDTLA